VIEKSKIALHLIVQLSALKLALLWNNFRRHC